MKKEDISDFTMRISQASRSELVVIMYEVVLCDIRDARESFAAKNWEEYDKSLLHAGRFVSELMAALDYNYGISYNLMSLYIFAHRRIVLAKAQKDVDLLDCAEDIMQKLLTGYRKVSEEDTSGPMMTNTQQVYAGLTYGRGVLNEMYVNANEAKRGYTA